jgi:hypothetical protein
MKAERGWASEKEMTMRERSFRFLAALAWLSCLALACAKLTETPNVGTNTNWLKACDTQDECGDGKSCLCGVCTRACSGDSACGAVHEGTSCQALTASACGSGGAASMACLQGCRSNAECTALQHGVCRDGLCVPAPDLDVDASVPSPPDANLSVRPDTSMSVQTPGPAGNDGGSDVMGSGFALSRAEATVVITDAYTECSEQSECRAVETSCNGCCEQGAIRRDLNATYEQNRTLACDGYTGAICDCGFADLVPRCELSRCKLVERTALDCFSPTQNVETRFDRRAVGCNCDWPSAELCFDGNLYFCASDQGGPYRWVASNDGVCRTAHEDPTCAAGEVRASMETCLAEFRRCYELSSGEFCGLP